MMKEEEIIFTSIHTQNLRAQLDEFLWEKKSQTKNIKRKLFNVEKE